MTVQSGRLPGQVGPADIFHHGTCLRLLVAIFCSLDLTFLVFHSRPRPFSLSISLLVPHRSDPRFASVAVSHSAGGRHRICSTSFRDTAFDTPFGETIVIAAVSFEAPGGAMIPASARANLGRSSDPIVKRLFAQLRPRAPYIVHFEHDGDISRYRPLLDCPAPSSSFSPTISTHTLGAACHSSAVGC